jgi:hypothetical protein
MSDVNYTLYEEGQQQNSNLMDYEIQFHADFGSANYQAGEPTIVSEPQAAGESLVIKLEVIPGNDQHIIHDFPIGAFPNGITNWMLDVEYVYENGVKINDKEVKTAQTEAEAGPRPIKFAK